MYCSAARGGGGGGGGGLVVHVVHGTLEAEITQTGISGQVPSTNCGILGTWREIEIQFDFCGRSSVNENGLIIDSLVVGLMFCIPEHVDHETRVVERTKGEKSARIVLKGSIACFSRIIREANAAQILVYSYP